MSRTPVLLALLVLSACGEAVDDKAPAAAKPAAPAVKAAAKDAEAEAAAADEAAPPEYFYNPAGKRDPFQSFIAHPENQQQLAADAPPLQRYEVDKFTLHGVVKDTAGNAALLVDPEGIGHVVRLGTYVGRNWGKVTSITDSGIVVTEEYQDFEGNLIVNPVTLRFPGSQP